MGKKVIVTGHNGYIGPWLVKHLKEQGCEVTGIDCNYFDTDCGFYPNPFRPDVSIVKDIRRVSESDLEGAYAICHLAALSNDPMGELNEELTYDINYKSTIRLAKLAKNAGVRKFLYSSSCSLYGIAGNEALDETAAFSPITAYAKSKVYSEQELAPLADSSFCVTFLRNATAYGSSPKLRVDLVVNNLLGWAFTKGKIRIMSDGSPWRPLVHCEDIARAFAAMVETDEKIINGEAFNVGQNSENFRVKEIAELVKKVLPACDIEITGEHGSDSRSYRVSFDRIKEQVPLFRPAWTLEKGIAQLLEDYKRYNLTEEQFFSRRFTRLKQLDHLIKEQAVNNDLYFQS